MTTLFTLYYYKEIQLSVLILFDTECSIPFSECCIFVLYAVHSYMQLKLYHYSDINITIQNVRLAEK